jgi:L-aspartate oxidase
MNGSAVDFLVLGGGIAGLSTAVELARRGTVLVLAKMNLEDCNTQYAAGGVAVVWDRDDNFDYHVSDTLTAGDGLCNEPVVREIVSKGPTRIQQLLDWGLEFDRGSGGEYDLGMEGGHSKRRVLHATDLTGQAILTKLLDICTENPNIELRPNQLAINLFIRNNHCIGSYVLDRQTGSIYAVRARATVLATGGAGKVYLYTSNPDVASGDGIAMGYRAGCRILNMEFVQFHPTCLFHPLAKNALISEALRGEGAVLRDIRGRRFMESVHPLAELAPRDIVSRAIDGVLKRTGDDHVLLDISFKDPEWLTRRFPGVHQKCLQFGIDFTREPIPVVPAAHYCCGGIEAQVNGTTNVPGLYAVGECTCTGLHGANRLASNSLLEGLVCGHTCGDLLQRETDMTAPLPSIPDWEPGNAVDSDEGIMITNNWNEIRHMMQNFAGIVKSDSSLLRARARHTLIHEEVDRYYWDFTISSDLVELRNLLTVARLIVESAIARKESRGIHYNVDYPHHSDLVKNTCIQKYW